ncbi:TetR/AcrR family transcriptional regulator [Anaerostipes sp.]|uniref:TetR/AcrR family transcriptional regulator n=1 Tax=Anaerostipes sp. TaxID=1872530 RepID=UPI0025C28136|nr:TetR-like C-terminal domain-containing protein [Anaerostipes sp.]MBS7006775.1 TetR/AcrR family transcriptional regulator C-terminal domain-containing protein [Anaerostipes sp.]
MDASERTKYKLAKAVKELMAYTPVDRITVKQIVECCGLTRQTFYRNFKDKYDLVNWYFDKLAIVSFEQMGVSLTLREGLIKKFEFIKGERHFFTAAFRSEDHNSLLQHDYDFIYRFYSDIIKKKLQKEIPADIRFLLEMYCRGSIYMTVQWVTEGMKRSTEEMADLLIRALPPELSELLKDL